MRARFSHRAACACTIALLGLGSLEYAGAADASPAKLAPEKLVQDFRIARRALEEAHSGIYRYTPKPEMDRIFDQAEKQLDHPMSVAEFYRMVAPVVAAVKCGHTGVQMPSATVEGPILPFRVRILDGKVYIFRDLSSEDGRLAGMEICSINGVGAQDILKKLIAATPADGDVESSRLYRVSGLTFSRQLSDLIGIRPPFDVVLRDLRHQEHRVHLQGQMRDRVTDAWRTRFPQDQRPKEAASLRYVDDGAVAVLKINGFGGRVGGPKPRPLGQFISDTFGELDSKKTATLIIDLRDNGGGADALGKPLLSYLVDESFRYYDDLVINALKFSFSDYISGRKTLPAEGLEPQPNGKYRAVKHPNWAFSSQANRPSGGRSTS